MVRRTLLQFAFALLALLVTAVHAQTVHTFSFGAVAGGGATMTILDGQPANCSIGYCGSVQLRGVPGGDVWWGLLTPQEPNGGWGFPNNGDNPNNTVYPLNPGPDTLLPSSCSPPSGTDFHQWNGCLYNTTTTVNMQGYAAGVTFTVTANYQVVFHKCVSRCYYADGNNDADDGYFEQRSLGGHGTAVYNPGGSQLHMGQDRDTVASIYRCGSDRKACLIADGGGPHCPRDLPNCKP